MPNFQVNPVIKKFESKLSKYLIKMLQKKLQRLDQMDFKKLLQQLDQTTNCILFWNFWKKLQRLDQVQTKVQNQMDRAKIVIFVKKKMNLSINYDQVKELGFYLNWICAAFHNSSWVLASSNSSRVYSHSLLSFLWSFKVLIAQSDAPYKIKKYFYNVVQRFRPGLGKCMNFLTDILFT